MGTVMALKGLQTLPDNTPRAERSTMETVIVTAEVIDAWKHPPFQRPLKVNEKVKALAVEIKASEGIIPGVITLGVHDKERYIIDGQHRLEAFKMSGLEEGICDVRVRYFESIGQMGEEFVNLNSALMKMRPDDILRGMEGLHEGIQLIRKRCPFIGYDQIRRSASKSPMLSMSLAIRAFYSSMGDVPVNNSGSTQDCVKRLTPEDAEKLTEFYSICHSAWASDKENFSLWSGLNLTMVGWMWHHIVKNRTSHKTPIVSHKQFEKFLMAVSADGRYAEWLVGRHTGERDRSPCYSRLREIFVKRLQSEFEKKIQLPQPPWSSHHGT